MSAECLNCSSAALNPLWGGYSMQCVRCCARLIASAFPDKRQMQVLRAAAELRSGRPSREEVKAELSRLEAQRKGLPASPTTSAQGSLL